MKRSRLTPGRVAYLAYYRPLAWLAKCRREGGPRQQWLDAQGRRAMMAAAAKLQPLPAARAGAPEIHLLTGRRFWYQSAFCVYSLRRYGLAARPVFVDDGTFDDELAAEARRMFPDARVLRADAIETQLDRSLPVAKFPRLRAQRETYLHLRKLTDVHAGHTGWRLVLDSDMLCFRRPEALIEWLGAPRVPLHMVDIKESYGYPAATLRELAGGVLPERLNVGVLGLRSETIDWEKIEWWCAQLLARHGTSYYLEQALVALWLAGSPAERLPETDYRVLPGESECREPHAVMHHYVDLSKRGYFRHAWRHVAAG